MENRYEKCEGCPHYELLFDEKTGAPDGHSCKIHPKCIKEKTKIMMPKKVEKANYDMTIENEGKIHITLDGDYKGNIKFKIKGINGTLYIPVQLSKESVEQMKDLGIEVFEHCGLIISC